jgi:hypothetical protein
MTEIYGKAALEEIRLVGRLQVLAASAFLATAGLLALQGLGALPAWWWLPSFPAPGADRSGAPAPVAPLRDHVLEMGCHPGISSVKPNAKPLARAVRSHRTIENALHPISLLDAETGRMSRGLSSRLAQHEERGPKSSDFFLDTETSRMLSIPWSGLAHRGRRPRRAHFLILTPRPGGD